MELAITRRKTDEVLTAARKDLEAQLALVRAQMGRLAAEERELTEAVSGLNGGGAASATRRANNTDDRSRTANSSSRRSSTRKTGTSRRRRPRGATKSTADRVKELQGVLADGPKSRNDLAVALKVPPARVQQLLAKLGSSVSSEPAPGQRQSKLWTLNGGANRAASAKPAASAAAPQRRKTTAAK